ncbi:mitochondrial 54S ribosomal protein uL15m NDAI_0A06020 [Naumovozyma dairenensis CBS 421]|uniref:Large ribosomal subunit protein uL15/eL18 domain-containing protein n=1 Tax=Naumovozyma dairenensis (strain ATCC 10597 / BCRC 20456 / CBS 421 / NBRC 0211 / NRRL Y-12639) TaxID=1071378 RepID=G0W4L9_NAUDC|nr:hypothetical protein NDAI_0A06020 [Naumovozyma dairenensis CBS 421]CCD22757.1 hypothetical protein NDAI_0A06020 [Naumovozyma dairenensis CBS 421]
MLKLLGFPKPRMMEFQLSFPRQLSILGELKPSAGSTKSFKRLGRGPSSGLGKTSGRGQKGQKARGKVKSWFEGGQTPIYKLFPKIGFTNVHSQSLNELNLERIQWFHDMGRLKLMEGEVLTMKKMRDLGLVTGTIKDGVKILGRGNYKLPIKIEATKASDEAVKIIESQGGSFVAKYFNKLGLRAHLSPQWFLEKRGRIPLQARPTKRKDIEYYSNKDKRGYLVMENHDFLNKLREVREGGTNMISRKQAKKSALEIQLQKLSKENNATSSPI